MTASFSSLAAFAGFLTKATADMKRADARALDKAARVVKAEAKGEIGHYQDQAGPFAGWDELAESTKTDRVRQGFSENDPLLRGGELYRSIKHEVREPKAYVGSDLPEAVFMELGTSHAPPRSFLGAAAFRKGHVAAQAAGGEVISALVGHEVHLGAMPINPEEL